MPKNLSLIHICVNSKPWTISSRSASCVRRPVHVGPLSAVMPAVDLAFIAGVFAAAESSSAWILATHLSLSLIHIFEMVREPWYEEKLVREAWTETIDHPAEYAIDKIKIGVMHGLSLIHIWPQKKRLRPLVPETPRATSSWQRERASVLRGLMTSHHAATAT